MNLNLPPLSPVLVPPWLIVDLGGPFRVLSWALANGGMTTAHRLAWREVRNRDLPPQVDPCQWLRSAAGSAGLDDAVTLVTSHPLDRHRVTRATAEGYTVEAVATVGLGNAERVGGRKSPPTSHLSRETSPAPFPAGTVNIGVRISCGLTDSALVEAVSIVASARTAAILDARIPIATRTTESPHWATGTGTDCIAVAAPPGSQAYCGLHTPLGEALGRAVYDGVRRGAEAWKEDWIRTVERDPA